MTNVFEQAITKEDGSIDFSKVLGMAPDYMMHNIQNIIPWIMNMLAQTKLSEEFIRKNFDYIPFATLIINNDVPQDIIEENIEAVFAKFIFGLGSEEFDEKVNYFFEQGYEPQVYEKIIEMCFTYFENDQLNSIEDGDIEDFSHLINAYSDKVSKEFIIKYSGNDAGYLLLTSALKRGDFIYEDLLNNLDLVTGEELWAWYEQFDGADIDEEGVYTLDNRNMVYTLMSVKASDKIIE
jgi:hypothetical protein